MTVILVRNEKLEDQDGMEIKTEELLKRICTADASELNEIMAAVTERFRQL